MRRAVPSVLLVAVVTLFAFAPAASAETITESVPRLQATPLEKACPMDVVATDRHERTATSTYDATRTLVGRRITGVQRTLFESPSLGTSILIETLGTTTIRRNADGTYTLVQRGTGYWYDSGTLSGTPQLVRFTGTVRSVGVYDASTFTFTPIETSISGVTASICDMLVTGLKARH